MSDRATLLALAERVEGLTVSDNAVDVLAEIALFVADDEWSSVRANAAGSKLIYTHRDGTEATFSAGDWTHGAFARKTLAAALRARAEVTP